MPGLIGWVSSVVLVLTIARQVYREWKSGTSEGVSKWLYIGQLAASAGFTAYSALVRNWVFIVTNSVMLVNAAVGLVIWRRHHLRRRAPSAPPLGGGFNATSTPRVGQTGWAKLDALGEPADHPRIADR